MSENEINALKTKLAQCQRLNKELLAQQEENETLSYGWAGNLGHWYMDVPTGHVVFNKAKTEALGYSMSELDQDIHYSFFTDKLHKEDHDKAMQSMLHAFKDPQNIYEVEYRIQHKDGSYRWFYDRGKVTQWSDDHRPLLVSGIVFDITDRKNEEELLTFENLRLEQENTTDYLTQIFNRRYVLEELQYRLNAHLTKTHKLSVIMLDIDDFKLINDTFGHLVGDKVLFQVAQIIQDTIRGFDIVGRFGGEEFLVVLPNTELSKAHHVAQRIIELVRHHDFGVDRQVTISAGVSAYLKDDTLESLIDRADQRLYKAKKVGKDKIVSK